MVLKTDDTEITKQYLLKQVGLTLALILHVDFCVSGALDIHNN